MSDIKSLSLKSKLASRQFLSDTADKLLSGKIDLEEFNNTFLSEIKSEYIRQYIFGRNGVENMTKKDWGSIGGNLSAQYKYAKKFLSELGNENISPKMLHSRLNLYSESSDEMFEIAFQRYNVDNGALFEHWIRDDAKENCVDCIDLENLGWVEIGTLPVPCDGSTRCGNNCGCHKEYTSEKDMIQESLVEMFMDRIGGPGSGNFGHEGRPGEVGGSGNNYSLSQSEVKNVGEASRDSNGFAHVWLTPDRIMYDTGNSNENSHDQFAKDHFDLNPNYKGRQGYEYSALEHGYIRIQASSRETAIQSDKVDLSTLKILQSNSDKIFSPYSTKDTRFSWAPLGNGVSPIPAITDNKNGFSIYVDTTKEEFLNAKGFAYDEDLNQLKFRMFRMITRPWSVKKYGSKWCVYDKHGKKMKCYSTEKEAEAYQKALYANSSKEHL